MVKFSHIKVQFSYTTAIGLFNNLINVALLRAFCPDFFAFWIAKTGKKWYKIRKMSRNGRGDVLYALEGNSEHGECLGAGHKANTVNS